MNLIVLKSSAAHCLISLSVSLKYILQVPFKTLPEDEHDFVGHNEDLPDDNVISENVFPSTHTIVFSANLAAE